MLRWALLPVVGIPPEPPHAYGCGSGRRRAICDEEREGDEEFGRNEMTGVVTETRKVESGRVRGWKWLKWLKVRLREEECVASPQ